MTDNTPEGLPPLSDLSEALSRGREPRRMWPLLHAVEDATNSNLPQLLPVFGCGLIVAVLLGALAKCYSTMSMWLGYYIDDYGTVCKPYDVSKKIIEKTKATNKSADAQRRIFLYNYGLNNGMMLVRLSKFTGLAQSK